MPLFDFHCTDCDAVFEREIPRGTPNPHCPECQKSTVEKLLKPPPAIFKGTGWYKTDSQRKPAKTSPSEDTNVSPSTSPSSDSKSTDVSSDSSAQKTPQK